MPIGNFHSFKDIKKHILSLENDEYHKKARTILKKTISIGVDEYTYKIFYGYKEDESSSWSIAIHSEKNENYIDFCVRIYKNYKQIISGNKKVLVRRSDSKWDGFKLVGKVKEKGGLENV